MRLVWSLVLAALCLSPHVSQSATQAERIAQALAGRAKHDSVVSKTLQIVEREYRAQRAAGKAAPLHFSIPDLQIMDTAIVVEIAVSHRVSDLEQQLTTLGARNIASAGFGISATLPIDALRRVGAIPGVVAVRASQFKTRTGTVTSQGDVASNAQTARARFGVTGAGVSIATMSDSYDCLGGAATGVANNDLPDNVVVAQELPDCSDGTDEGRAMMEIIHDLAPGAQQVFATAGIGRANFANSIRQLGQNGVDIIVDDIGYFDQPFFQDGPVAQAVDAVHNQFGTIYFSAAGNSGNESYEGGFNIGSDGISHDFDPGPGEDLAQQIRVPVGSTLTVLFQWAEPYASVSGAPGAATDMDICLFDQELASRLICAEDPNIGADPLEILQFDNSNGPDQIFNLVIQRFEGSAAPFLKTIVDGGQIQEFDTNSSTSYGHPNAEFAEGVGTANFFDTPAFGTSPPQKASYSSTGGLPIAFDGNGNSISPIVRNKPNLSCVDGANTTFFGDDTGRDSDGFPNFFGTSAAAPHAAAIAALIRQVNPALTAVEVFQAMESTATDMAGAGFDFETGAGLCHAERAVAAAQGASTGGTQSASRRLTPTLAVDPSRACPGFYIGKVAGLNAEGRWSMEILLDPAQRPLLQGGLNLGGGFGNSNQPGFAAFNIANQTGEPQMVQIDLTVQKPAAMTYQVDIVRRQSGQQTLLFSDTSLASAVTTSGTLDPGFYSVRVFGVGPLIEPATFNMSLSTRFTNRPGGAFQGGVNLGGLITAGSQFGSNEGFGALCIDRQQPVSFQTFGNDAFGAAGIANLRLQVLDRDRNVVVETP